MTGEVRTELGVLTVLDEMDGSDGSEHSMQHYSLDDEAEEKVGPVPANRAPLSAQVRNQSQPMASTKV